MSITEFPDYMEIANGLVAKLKTSSAEWETAITDCDDAVFNKLTENGWSPAQVVMHVMMTEKGINGVLTGPSEPAEASRKTLIERIGRGLTDTTRKFKSPAFLEPRAEHYDKQKLLEKFRSNRVTLEQIITNSGELNNVFTTFPHPYFGFLTGNEWAVNVVHHANRHFMQFHNVINVSSGSRPTP